MMVTLWARLPLLDPLFGLYIGKTGPPYDPNIVHLKPDFIKTTYYVCDQQFAMFKTSIWAQEQKNDCSEYLLK